MKANRLLGMLVIGTLLVGATASPVVADNPLQGCVVTRIYIYSGELICGYPDAPELVEDYTLVEEGPALGYVGTALVTFPYIGTQRVHGFGETSTCDSYILFPCEPEIQVRVFTPTETQDIWCLYSEPVEMYTNSEQDVFIGSIPYLYSQPC